MYYGDNAAAKGRESARRPVSRVLFFFSSCCRLSTILLFSLFFSAEPACAYPQFLSRTAPFAPPLRPERPVWMTRNASQPNKKTKKATFSCVFGIRGCPHSWLPIIVSAVLSILFFFFFAVLSYAVSQQCMCARTAELSDCGREDKYLTLSKQDEKLEQLHALTQARFPAAGRTRAATFSPALINPTHNLCQNG